MSSNVVQPKPTGTEALAVLARLQTDGYVSEAVVQEQLAAVRAEIQGGTHARVAEAGAPTAELSPEQVWFGEFKTRFDAIPQLHQEVQWADVEKSLKADPESMRKLQLLDEAGFEMNVFGEKNGEIVFRTAQTDVTKIASKYRIIMADKKAQGDYPQYSVNGNAEEIALSLGVEVADPELYEQHRVQNGWVWLKTNAATRQTGSAFYGSTDGVAGTYANFHDGDGSFCAALRVKKA